MTRPNPAPFPAPPLASLADDAMCTAFEAASSYVLSLIKAPGNLTRPVDRDDSHRRGRERIAHFENLLRELGDPHRAYPVVHVAGTSGKGSVCTFVAGICRASGLETGSHLTPYLQTPLEKLVVNDRLADRGEFVELVDWFKGRHRWLRANGWRSEPRYGSTWVALTFEYFRRQNVDIAVIEAGAGGRYDLTNVVEPVVAAVTSVGLDHVLSLGPTLHDIAIHKAGVFKQGAPAIAIDTGDESFDDLKSCAVEAGAVFQSIRRGGDYWPDGATGTFSRLAYRGRNFEIGSADLGLAGAHQIENAAVACAIADALVDAGYPITQKSVEDGLTGARLPGRWEVVSDSPNIILDGAHNPDKAAALASALKTKKRGRRLALVVGVLGYKAVDGIVSELASVADFVVATEPTVYMKAPLAAADLGRIALSTGVEVAVLSDSSEALDAAVGWAGPDGIVCVTGSLYLVGQVRERWYPSSAINAQRTAFPTFPNQASNATQSRLGDLG